MTNDDPPERKHADPTTSMPQENDRRYKKLYENIGLFRDLLRYTVKPDWLSEADLDGVELLKTESLAGSLARRQSDLVYKIPFKDGSTTYLVLFLEFQSCQDRFMALRMSTYMHLFWESMVDLGQLTVNRKLPPVFGLVLYNGQPRWRSPTKLTELIELPHRSQLLQDQPNFQYHVIDEGRIRAFDEQSLNHVLFQMEFCQNSEQLVDLVEQVLVLARKVPGHANTVKAVLRWFDEAMFRRIELEMPIGELLENLEEPKLMLAETLQKWRDELLLEGKAEGRVEGKAEGKAEGITTVAVEMLRQGADEAFIL